MNEKIIDEFKKLINQIEFDLTTANGKERTTHQFRLKNIKNALKIIKKYDKEITSGADLKNIAGIGKGVMDRIDEILKKGKLSEIKLKKSHTEYLKELEELSSVINIGKRTAAKLIKMGITTIEQLKKAHKDGKIALPRNILIGLKYYGKIQENIPRAEITKYDALIQKEIKKIDPNLISVIAGSYRRQKPTSSDVDCLLVHSKVKTEEQLKNLKLNYAHLLVEQLKKDNIILDDLDPDFTTKYLGFARLDKKHPIRRIDIHYVPYNSYFTALLHATGSGPFNEYMRGIAKKKGYRLSEYGLYKIKDGKKIRVKVNSEKEIFDILGIPYRAPKEREVS